jgi:hypothetical protein
MPQSLEQQLRGALATIDAAQVVPSPPYLPPASGDTLTPQDRSFGRSPSPMPTPSPSPGAPTPSQPQMNNAMDMIRSGRGWTVGATPVPPPQSAYAPINNAISSIGNVSRPGMFDNTSQPLGSMFSPGQYRGR